MVALREKPVGFIPWGTKIPNVQNFNGNPLNICFDISVLKKWWTTWQNNQQIATRKTNLPEWTKTPCSVTYVKCEGVIIVSYPLWCKCWFYQFQNLEEVYKNFAFVQARKDNGTSAPTVHPVICFVFSVHNKNKRRCVSFYSWQPQHLLSHKSSGKGIQFLTKHREEAVFDS